MKNSGKIKLYNNGLPFFFYQAHLKTNRTEIDITCN